MASDARALLLGERRVSTEQIRLQSSFFFGHPSRNSKSSYFGMGVSDSGAVRPLPLAPKLGRQPPFFPSLPLNSSSSSPSFQAVESTQSSPIPSYIFYCFLIIPPSPLPQFQHYPIQDCQLSTMEGRAGVERPSLSPVLPTSSPPRCLQPTPVGSYHSQLNPTHRSRDEAGAEGSPFRGTPRRVEGAALPSR